MPANRDRERRGGGGAGKTRGSPLRKAPSPIRLPKHNRIIASGSIPVGPIITPRARNCASFHLVLAVKWGYLQLSCPLAESGYPGFRSAVYLPPTPAGVRRSGSVNHAAPVRRRTCLSM